MKKIVTTFLILLVAFATFGQQKIIVKPDGSGQQKIRVNPDGTIQRDNNESKIENIGAKKDDNILLVSPGQDTLKAIHLHPDQLLWKGVMPPLPAGAKVAVLEGSPKEKGMFTIRFQLPPHWQLPAHTHPGDERVTVLSGSVYVGFGDVLDTKKATKYNADSFYLNPAGSHHFIFTEDEASVIQITAEGPWKVDFLTNGQKNNSEGK